MIRLNNIEYNGVLINKLYKITPLLLKITIENEISTSNFTIKMLIKIKCLLNT